MVAALLVLLVPLRSLTKAPSAPGNAALPLPAAPVSKVRLQILSTAVPFTFEVSHLGKVIWRGESPVRSAQTEVALPFPKEGVDLRLDVTWPGQETAAVKFEIDGSHPEPVAQTVWGDGSVSEVLTFK
jgi:hypothetical protein